MQRNHTFHGFPPELFEADEDGETKEKSTGEGVMDIIDEIVETSFFLRKTLESCDGSQEAHHSSLLSTTKTTRKIKTERLKSPNHYVCICE